VSNFVEFCLWNIAQSDEVTVEEAIQTFNATVEVVSIFSVEITVLIDQLIVIVCPGQPVCSGRGRCQDAVCICDQGILSAHSELH